MQQTILDSLYSANNVLSEGGRIRYLQGLQQPAIQLRNGFFTFPVSIDYSRRDYQSVYMLRYFPGHSQIIKSTLHSLHSNPGHLPFSNETFDVSFIGCGPGPEIYGFFEFLNGTVFRPRVVNVHTFDIISDHWTFSRNITFQRLLPLIWRNRTITAINHNFNLASHNSIDPHLQAIRNSKIVVFQNCLNEIPDRLYPVVIQNIESIIRSLQTNSILLIIDLLNYAPVLDLLAHLATRQFITDNTDIIRSVNDGENRFDAAQIINATPQIVSQNLLTDASGLIPRRWFRYHHMALRRGLVLR